MPQSTVLLEACRIGRRHPNGLGWLVANVSLRVSADGRLALVGASGAGKTVLLRALALLGVVRDLRLPSADRRGRQRRLRVTIDDPARPSEAPQATVHGLSSKRAFLETRALCEVGAPIRLRAFQLREAGARTEQAVAEMPPADATVEYVNLHGLGVRFEEPSPQLSEFASQVSKRP